MSLGFRVASRFGVLDSGWLIGTLKGLKGVI